MNFNHTNYIPCLRWKLGEYQAVWRLPVDSKRRFAPLIEVPGLGWDFEEGKEKKTIDQLLSGFVIKKIYRKWGRSPCFLDLNHVPPTERMKDGVHPVHFVFNELRTIQCMAVPVTGLFRDSEYQREIKAALDKDKNGICLRITIEQAAESTFKSEINALLSTLGSQPADCDFILDLYAPNFVPLDGFAQVIQAIATALPYLNNWRTFTVLGTSFPESMGSVKKGGEIVSRYEWQLYKILIANFHKAKLRLPSFGDYAVNHPKELELDMRKIKPAATIRYTIDDNWYIVKGDNVRDNGFEQYCDLCNKILRSSHYCGPAFSWGDDHINKCASGSVGTGNLSTWRQVGTNHHIEKVIQDIASFYAS